MEVQRVADRYALLFEDPTARIASSGRRVGIPDSPDELQALRCALGSSLMTVFLRSCMALALSLCAVGALAQAQPPTIRIGLILPLTGGSSDMGNSARVGAQIAVDELNEVRGLLGGRRIELVIRDDKADPDAGRKAAEELVLKEHVFATIGFCNTGVAAKALDVFQNNKQVLIVPCATGTLITAKYPARESYIFRTAARDALQTDFLADEVAKRHLSKPAFLVDSTGYGDAGLVDLKRAFAKFGIAPVVVIRFPVGVTTLVDEVRNAKAAGADSLIGWTVGPESGVLSLSRLQSGWKVPQFGPWGLSHRSAFEASHGAVESAMMVQTVLPNSQLERNTAFLLQYYKLSGEPMIGSVMSAAQTYDSVQLLVRAMIQAKSDPSGPSLKRSLENLPNRYPGVVTSYVRPFTETDHDAVSANMLWLGTWRDGRRTYYYSGDERLGAVVRYKR
jgi:branched-chain amino acid transport system substrate-binding protein